MFRIEWFVDDSEWLAARLHRWRVPPKSRDDQYFLPGLGQPVGTMRLSQTLDLKVCGAAYSPTSQALERRIGAEDQAEARIDLGIAGNPKPSIGDLAVQFATLFADYWEHDLAQDTRAVLRDEESSIELPIIYRSGYIQIAYLDATLTISYDSFRDGVMAFLQSFIEMAERRSPRCFEWDRWAVLRNHRRTYVKASLR